jgi:alpha-L-fucosidase
MDDSGSNSFRNRPLPQWYDDAKLGIFIHWGPSAVPGWAPMPGQIWEQANHFEANPYAEWYWNSMQIEGGPSWRYHREVWGADFAYPAFAPLFNQSIRAWKPEQWADVIARTGARYVVLVTKHHDGFLLWPSEHRNPKAPDYVASRDIVGELSDAVRARGLRMGLYYSGGIDWLWHPIVIRNMRDMARAIPQDPAYLAYASAHWRELIDRYRPCSMWNDIAFPGDPEHLERLFEHYYAAVPDGIVNDRFRWELGPDGLRPAAPHDTTTPEYQAVPEIRGKKWEAVRGIGHSFGYNRDEGEEQYLSARDLVQLFVDIVSKNGNLLLDFGPRADGSIPEPQLARLEALGDWLRVNGEAIWATRPWTRAEGQTRAGGAVRYTRGRDALYALLLDPAAGAEVRIDEPQLAGSDGTGITLLGSQAPLAGSRDSGGIQVRLPDPLPCDFAVALRIAPGGPTPGTAGG